MKNALNSCFPRPVRLSITGLFMALLLYSSTLPSLKVKAFDQTLIDRILDFSHLPVYVCLTLLLMWSFGMFQIRTQIAAFFIAGIFGVLNESVQLSTVGRSFSLSDMCVNACGALLAIICFNGYKKYA